MRWNWLPEYALDLAQGVLLTLELMGLSLVLGFALALPLGLAQAAGPKWLAWPARAFCTVIRGTPLLIQLWLIYYGIGSLFPSIPGIRDTMIWPLLRDAFPYAVLAFTLSVAGYEGEVMRGGFAAVPKGEREAGSALGLSKFQVFRLIWLPRAIRKVLPVLGGELILTLKATPLAATITIYEVYGVTSIIRQETYRIYEPLLLLAGIYLCLTFVIVTIFRQIENRVPGT